MVNVEVSYKGFPIANIPEGQTGRLACRGKKMVSDVTIAYKSTGVNKLAQIVDNTVTELTAADLKGATAICGYAFYGRTDLVNIEIPNSVTSIGGNAFTNCTGLTNVEIPNSVTSIEGYAFEKCTSLKSITIPNSVTSIGKFAFRYCKMTSFIIPNSVTSISLGMFNDCRNLTSITIPNSVTSIEGYVFQYCTSLTSITIPNSVTSIGSCVFQYCSALKKVDFSQATAVPTLSNKNSFASVPTTCKIVVPDSLYDTWVAATNWSALTQTFVKASEYTGG